MENNERAWLQQSGLLNAGLCVTRHPLLVPGTKPVIELSDEVSVSDRFRFEFNAWLENLFGSRSMPEIIWSSWQGRDVVYVSQRVFDLVQEARRQA